MSRHILDEQHLHPAIRPTVAGHHRDTVEAVQAAILEHRVVVIGMKGNPVVTKARMHCKRKTSTTHTSDMGAT